MARPQGRAIMIKTSITVYHRLQNKVTEIYQKLNLKQYEKTKGRKLKISIIDSITLALFKQKQNIVTKKSLFEMIGPNCSYKTLVTALNATIKSTLIILTVLLKLNQEVCHSIKHHDATDIPVCHLRKSKSHKTMESLSSYSKTGKGWFYGLKLHLTSDLRGRILGIKFTSANSNDREIMKEMTRKLKGIFVVDAGYISKELEKEFSLDNERWLITVPRANMKKIATLLEIALQRSRMRIELHFRNLKLFFNLITGLPRSIDGYLQNYLSSLLAYMIA